MTSPRLSYCTILSIEGLLRASYQLCCTLRQVEVIWRVCVLLCRALRYLDDQLWTLERGLRGRDGRDSIRLFCTIPGPHMCLTLILFSYIISNLYFAWLWVSRLFSSYFTSPWRSAILTCLLQALSVVFFLGFCSAGACISAQQWRSVAA